MSDKPKALPVEHAAIPPELRAIPQWLVWRLEEPRRPGDKRVKMPYTPGGTTRAKTNDRRTWRPFAEALAAYEKGGYDGLGFVFSPDDPYVGIDLDGAYDPDTQQYTDKARDVLLLLNSYSELSTSGTGVHIVVKGLLPFNGGNQGWCEVYQSLRFFAMTGCAIPGLPPEVESRQQELDAFVTAYFPRPEPVCGGRRAPLATVCLEDATLIDQARNASNGAKFDQLWNGRWQSAGYVSQSNADMALASMLRFWTQDVAQIKRLVSQSGLYRDKWDAKRGGTTYGEYTANKAISRGGDTYQGSNSVPLVFKPKAKPPTATDDAPDPDPVDLTPDPEPEPEQPEPRYVLHWAKEAFDPLPPISWVVDSLYSRGSVSLVVGAPGTKKTYALLDCAVAVSTGDLWLGRATTQGTVLVIDEESGNHRLRRRLKEIMRGHKTGINLPIAYTTLAAWNLLSSPTDIQQIDNLFGETQPVLVILDALADVMPGGDENAVKDTHPIFQRLRALAEKYCCAVVVIHHAGKTGGYRGSTAIAGAVDLLLMVESEKGSRVVKFRVEKSRDTEPQDFAGEMIFDEVMGTAHMIGYATEVTPEPVGRAEQYVLNYLGSHNGKADLTDIVNGADVCSPATARRALYRLAENGKVRRADLNGSGVKATYELC